VAATSAPGAAAARVALPLAAIGPRLAAALYEALLLLALLFITGFVLLPLATPGHAGGADALVVPPLPTQAMLFCLEFAAAALYCGWCWTGGRRTLPQKTWRLRLLTIDGRATDRKRALLRYITAWIGPLAALALYRFTLHHAGGALALALLPANFAWAWVDRERQFLHDRLAGTRIMRAVD
jgi:uncharacterized RDD family membrane protein YckC